MTSPANLMMTEKADSRRQRIGVALSGTGSRAALFGLGSLLFLKDAGLAERVGSISSVSGGSVLNAHVALNSSFAEGSIADFDEHAARLAKGLKGRSLVGPTVAVAVIAGLALTATIFTAGWPVDLGRGFDILLVAAWFVAYTLRHHLVGFGLARRSQIARRPLESIDTSIEHVFCTTDLLTGLPFYLSGWNGGHVFCPRRSWGKPAKISLATVVRASTAFPGSLPAKRIQLERSRLRRSHVAFPLDADSHGKDDLPPAAYLADGGAWNSLGTDWFLEWRKRIAGAKTFAAQGDDNPWPMPQLAPPDQLLIVSASSPVARKRLAWLQVPLLGPLVRWRRLLRLQYVNTVLLRINSMRHGTRLQLGFDSRTVLSDSIRVRRAAVASIDEQLPTSRRVMTDNKVVKLDWGSAAMRYAAERAATVAAALPIGSFEFPDGEWVNVARLHTVTSAMKTTLGRLSDRDALLLTIQGYLAAMTQCRVVFDLPDASSTILPEVERFTRVLGTRPRDVAKISQRRPERRVLNGKELPAVGNLATAGPPAYRGDSLA